MKIKDVLFVILFVFFFVQSYFLQKTIDHTAALTNITTVHSDLLSRLSEKMREFHLNKGK